MRKTTYLLAFMLISALSIAGQSLEGTCWNAIDQNNHKYWKLEYGAGDSLFMTGYNADHSIYYARRHFGSYQQNSDTVTFNYLSWHPCGTVAGVYTISISNNQMYFEVVNDPCPDRGSWHIAALNAHIRCDASSQVLINTCWAGFENATGDYYVMEFTEGDSLFLTGYDNNGILTTPRQQHGNYSYSNNMVTFVMDPPGGSCGVDSGVYRLKFLNDNMKLLLESDACATRVDFMTSDYNYYDCAFHRIDIDEIPLRPTDIKIYPNPASKSFTIEQPGKEFDQNTKVVLYDLLGNKLLEENTGQADNTYTLNVGHLSSGVYILQLIEHNTVMAIERVVINQ